MPVTCAPRALSLLAAVALLTCWVGCDSGTPSSTAPAARPVPAFRLPAVANGAETLDLFGAPLEPPPLEAQTRADRAQKLEEARTAYEGGRESLDNIIWLGRRQAYLGRYRDAIDTYTKGLLFHPESPRLYRHRGHRYITLRHFDAAVRDLERALQMCAGKPDETELDGLPNAKNIPLGTLHFNVYYHLGLAHYLGGRYENALDCYLACLKVCENNDVNVATGHWVCMTLRRLGRDDDLARVLEPYEEDMEIIENHGYFQLVLLYKGLRTPEQLLDAGRSDIQSATVGYGLASWYHAEGQKEKGIEMMKRIVRGPQWTAFGHVAAEADLKRWGIPIH